MNQRAVISPSVSYERTCSSEHSAGTRCFQRVLGSCVAVWTDFPFVIGTCLVFTVRTPWEPGLCIVLFKALICDHLCVRRRPLWAKWPSSRLPGSQVQRFSAHQSSRRWDGPGLELPLLSPTSPFCPPSTLGRNGRDLRDPKDQPIFQRRKPRPRKTSLSPHHPPHPSPLASVK